MIPTKLLLFFCAFALCTNSECSQGIKDDSPSSLREMFLTLPQRIRGYSSGSLENPPSLSIEERTRLAFLEEDRQTLFNKIALLQGDITRLTDTVESLAIHSKVLEIMIKNRDKSMINIGDETTLMCSDLVQFIKKTTQK